MRFRHLFLATCGFLVVVLGAACSENVKPNTVITDDSAATNVDLNQIKACGSGLLIEMQTEGQTVKGYLELMNDSARVYIKLSLSTNGAEMAKGSIRVENESGMFLEEGKFAALSPGKYWHSFDIRAKEHCLRLKPAVEVKDPETGKPLPLTIQSANSTEGAIKYCVHTCKELQNCSGSSILGQFKSYGFAQWFGSGAEMNSFATQNFKKTFPLGIILRGCGKDTQLTTLSDLSKWAASHKDAGLNKLAEEVAALKLNITYDEQLEDFAPAKLHFGDLFIRSGDFEGWTTEELLAEASAQIDDCPSNYSTEQMVSALRQVNQSTKDSLSAAYLSCEQPRR